jgi:AcrR family transcriptional regulator
MAKAAAKTSTRPLSRVGDADLVERRRAQIVEAATRLVARQGFAKTVVRDIAEEANISVGLVYEYVRSKEDILFLIYEHWARVWGEGLEKALARSEDPLDQLMSGVSFLVTAADKHADVTHLFYRETGHLSDYGTEQAKQTEREMVDRLTAVVEAGIAADLLSRRIRCRRVRRRRRSCGRSPTRGRCDATAPASRSVSPARGHRSTKSSTSSNR